MARQAAKREATREQILAAAEALFTERGFEAAAVEEIAARADVAKGTVYYHFPSKEAMAAALGREAMRQEESRLLELLSAGTAPTIVLWRLMQGSARWMEGHANLAKVVLFSGFTGEIVPGQDSLWGTAALVIAAGQKRGEIRADMPAGELAGMLGGLYLHAMGGWLALPDGPPLKQRLEQALQIFLEGTGARG